MDVYTILKADELVGESSVYATTKQMCLLSLATVNFMLTFSMLVLLLCYNFSFGRKYFLLLQSSSGDI